jgi:type II secretory pathway component HofQ
MDWRSWSRRAWPVVLAGLAAPLAAQAPAQPPPDLFVTRLQGTTTTVTPSPTQGTSSRAAGLSPFGATTLDERLAGMDLDGPRRISLSVSRPMPLRELLLLLVNGTPLSLVTDEAADGTFLGELKDLTMRQALEAVLFSRGLDYDMRGTLVRVFPRKASTRLFDLNYLNVRRRSQRDVRSAASVDDRRSSSVDASSASESDRVASVTTAVQALLSSSGRMHLDRDAGIVQVTDFSDRLDLVGVYLEAAEMRAMRQVRIDAQVLEVTFAEGASGAIDWAAVKALAGAGVRASDGHGAAGAIVSDIESLKRAIAEQGTLTLLAAPQVVAMNNQPSIVQVGTERVYAESASRVEAGGRGERTSRAGAVLEGLTLTVTPQVSADGLVLLSVAPTYTRRANPSKLATGDIFPLLHISEVDTMLRVRDGETIVLSGFLESRQSTKPATGLSAMFGAQPRTIVKSELVILLTPQIVGPGIPPAARAR